MSTEKRKFEKTLVAVYVKGLLTKVVFEGECRDPLEGEAKHTFSSLAGVVLEVSLQETPTEAEMIEAYETFDAVAPRSKPGLVFDLSDAITDTYSTTKLPSRALLLAKKKKRARKN